MEAETKAKLSTTRGPETRKDAVQWVLPTKPRRQGTEHLSRVQASVVRWRLVVRFKRILSRLAQPWVLLVLGIITIAISATAIYYYTLLSGEIDARLRRDSFDNSTGIFTAPFKVAVGDRLPLDQLLDYLRAAGYKQKPAVDKERDDRSFSVNSKAVEIVPGPLGGTRLGLEPVRIEIDNTGHVVSLVDLRAGQRVPSSAIEGELLASVKDGDRHKTIAVQFSGIPGRLREAVLALEDQRFFSHNGIDWRGIARAFWADIREGEIVQGGSTITQQLIKNAFLTRDRTFSRKVKEAGMAVILESRLSKEDIFTLYCNDVYLGQSGTFAIHGFAQAAKVYFDKNLSDLTLAESALLAGLIPAPNRYSADRDPSKALARRSHVLDRMVATEAISPEEAETAKQEPLEIKKHAMRSDYGITYFIDYAQRFIGERRGSDQPASQRVYTTMDPRLQRIAYDAVTEHTERIDKLLARSARKGAQPTPVQAALVALDAHTGEVLAMIGGRSYDESQLNRATDSMRQPGSTFKPFVYASALKWRAFTAATILSDRPQTFTYDGGRSQYKPSNYHGGFTNRDVTLREALARSLNVPAVELAQRVGLVSVANLAEECGLQRPCVYPSMALGSSEVTPLELAAAYTAFANGGTALRPVPIESMSGTAETNYAKPRAGTPVFSTQVAYLMTSFLESVVDRGTAARLRVMGLKGAIAGKTGTTRDGWFVGYTPNLVCAVWVGFDDNRDLGLKGSASALPIWADFVKQATDVRPALGGSAFPRPSGIVTADIDPTTGYLTTPECPEHRQELFIAGTEPFASCTHEIASEDSLTADEHASPYRSDEQNIDDDTIMIAVCTETRMIASPDCPHFEKMRFNLGKGPLENCGPEHHPKTLVGGRPQKTPTLYRP